MNQTERRLWDEFEYFCKYRCKNSGVGMMLEDAICDVCDLNTFVEVSPCDYCQTKEYIRHIRGEI